MSESAPAPVAAPASTPNPAPPPASAPPEAPDHSTSAAVQKCCASYHQTLAAERAGGAKISDARDKAKEAYRNAMPFLSSRISIREFIACVAHGMLLNIFWGDEGIKLISAARAATAVLPREWSPLGRPKSTEQHQ